jgi:hypothetical protein
MKNIVIGLAIGTALVIGAKQVVKVVKSNFSNVRSNVIEMKRLEA